jgi:hypothetical protein
MACATSFVALVMWLKAMISSLAKAPRFLLPEGPLSEEYIGLSAPSRITMFESWVSASSGDEEGGTGEPKGSSEPME